MVGLADIPFVGKAVDKISDATVEAFYRGLRYMFCYKHLVDVLNSEIEHVEIEEEKICSKVVAARADGKIIYDHVLKWQIDVEEFHKSSKEFSKKYKARSSWRCIKRLPIPNPLTRFQLGREAVEKTNRVIELSTFGLTHLADEIAYFPTGENLPKPDTSFQDFKSRKDAYKKLWEALTEGSSVINGIYGMPGVGKTRMMEQLWEEAKKKMIFDKVTRADVGNDTLDVIKLQGQIAGHLGCHFISQDDIGSRANQLRNSLLNGQKILVILDDVWTEIPLDTIGIPYSDSGHSKGCKILFTSREETVCLLNKCKQPVNITILTDDEAWDLFSNTVEINSLQDDTLVRGVCKKCAGLPLLICAVGKALKYRSRVLWEDALYNLEKGGFENIPGINPQAYACVKLSIDRLPDGAKSCLFLCSLFPEDADIDIRTLITLAMGSQPKLTREPSIRAMVEIIRSYSLSLVGTHGVYIKLHDIVRHVANSLASLDPKYAFSQVRCGSRLPDDVDFATRKLLRLDVEGDDFQFHEDLVCLHLHSLWLHCNNNQQQFGGGFFSMFVNLEFLMLQSVSSFPEEFSLQRLGKLRELCIIGCDIKEKDLSLLPEHLKGLCIRDCHLPNLLDISNLKNLRKLEIQGNPVVLVPNTISNLCNLEELRIPNGYCYFGDASDRLAWDEISRLTHLTSLEIHLRDFEPCQGTTLFSELHAYNICLSVPAEYNDSRIRASFVSTTRLIEVYDYHSRCLESLMLRTEELSLCFSNVEVGSICNSNREAFVDLRRLNIRECNTMDYLARISGHEIQQDHQPWTNFSKLTILHIEKCSAMKYLWCNSVARCLVHLQTLEIIDCPLMEVLMMNEGTSDGDIIEFPQLKLLKLSKLPLLRSFCGKQKDTDLSSACIAANSAIPSVQYRALFDGTVAFPLMENLMLKQLQSISDIWGKHYYDIDYISSFSKLKTLEVYMCRKLEAVISRSMLHRLRNLESLDIEWCRGLRSMFVTCIARDLTHLKDIHLRSCSGMTEIIGGGEEEEITGAIVFPELTALTLANCQRLTRFCCSHTVEFPNVIKCDLSAGKELNLETIELGRDDSSCQLNDFEITCESRIPTKWQVRFHNLAKLGLSHYRWSHELKLQCFKKLTTLVVFDCKCSTVFGVSIFRSLQQLHTLVIMNSDTVEEIVEDVTGDPSASDMENNTITLFQLEILRLANLPNLKCFSSTSSYVFNMPKLRNFDSIGSPGLEYFTSLKTITGLVCVEPTYYFSTHPGTGRMVEDLNDYIRSERAQSAEDEQPLEQGIEEEQLHQDKAEEEQLEVHSVEDERVQKEQPLVVTLFFFPWSCPWAY